MKPIALSKAPVAGEDLPIRVLACRESEQHCDGTTGSPLRVRDWMTRQVQTVDPNDPVARAVDVMTAEGVRHVVVSRGGTLCGVLSTEDLLRAAHRVHARSLYLDLDCRLVRGVMTSTPLTAVEADSLLAVAAARMGDERVTFLPVLDGKRVVGVLTTDDLLAALCTHSRPPRARKA
jgi:acetoin utilization protein AcuB